ncbi:hypothetical protein POM88_001686 [Heracleum sosnowskyi]|uniref:Uncharacterized protein n=1 Tax=Heracleum sosnowskyi TaxID=360622 RepID=A0AAD8JE60_9APIA|nr:hypothetical protein POM88_001686 [Heracleum sosnowskyi]
MASSSSSSPPSRNAAVSPPRNPNLSDALSRSCKIDDVSDDSKIESLAENDDSSLVGWWCGISKDGKDPYGHIIHVSAEHGRYLARSYSPWQLAASKEGTALFEICITTSEVGEHNDQAIYLKHKADAQDGRGMGYVQRIHIMSMFQLTPESETDKGLLETIIMNIVSANQRNATNPMLKLMCSELNIDPSIITKAATGSGRGDLDGKNQNVIWIEFVIGSFKETNARKVEKEVHRVPAVLERKGCFSFCLTVEEDKDHQFGDNILEGYRTVDHCTFDVAESLATGKLKKEEDEGKFWPTMCSQARNEQPVLSGLTTFNKINATASSDPLTGLYVASNGFLVTEVIQFTRKFGQWQEIGETEGSSKTESYDYVEAVKLTGDPDVPAGQVSFRAKVGEQYKLAPGSVLEQKFGAVARYKGKGRLTGFQNSGWVDVEVFVLGEKYRKDGFALGFLYSSKYHVWKLFKQLSLPSFQKSP